MLKPIIVMLFILFVMVGGYTGGHGQTIPQPGAYLPYIAVPPPTATPTATSTPTATATPTATPTKTPVPTATPLRFVCSHDFYNCGDFFIWGDAQEVFMYCMAVVGIDIHKLDQDNDNIACEALLP